MTLALAVLSGCFGDESRKALNQKMRTEVRAKHLFCHRVQYAYLVQVLRPGSPQISNQDIKNCFDYNHKSSLLDAKLEEERQTTFGEVTCTSGKWKAGGNIQAVRAVASTRAPTGKELSECRQWAEQSDAIRHFK